MMRVDDEFSADIPQNKLKSMIKQVIFSVSNDETKAILNGVCLEFDSDNTLVMVALDGFRIAMRKEKINNCTGKKSVVIPKRAMQEIAAVLSSDDSEVKLIFSSTHIKIDFGGTKVISRLLDGEYVNYKGILPKNLHKSFDQLRRVEEQHRARFAHGARIEIEPHQADVCKQHPHHNGKQ